MSTKTRRTVKPVDNTQAPVQASKLRLKKGEAQAPTTEVVAKPRKAAPPPVHTIETTWTQPSTVLNARASRTAINFSAFGSLTQAPLTDRDRKSLHDLRQAFQKKVFQRGNLDTGILRRMGERGYLEHVEGSNVSADATFRLTAKAFTKDAMAS